MDVELMGSMYQLQKNFWGVARRTAATRI